MRWLALTTLLMLGYIGHSWELLGAWAWVPAFLAAAIGAEYRYEIGVTGDPTPTVSVAGNPAWLVLGMTSEHVDAMFRFYLSTIESRYWGRQYLNREVFDLFAERFRSRLRFVVASHEGEMIAGTFNVEKGDALYGRYWGATRMVRHLHFNVCYYAAIEYCIEHGIGRFEPGAGGDYKFLRGFDAHPTYSLHYLSDPRLAEAVGRFLAAERDDANRAIDHLHDRSALKHP